MPWEVLKFMDNREHYLRTFEDQLYDSVYLLYFAFDTNQDDYPDDVISPFIRSSILNSALLLESAANCLIESLDLPNHFYNEIEKLPFIAKYEFFLNKVSESKTINRGCKEVQRITELKSIRDFYVHPKVKRSQYFQISENVWDANYGETKQLKLPRDPKLWTRDHAIESIKAVTSFFNVYFLDWCSLTCDSVVDLLLSSEKVDFSKPLGAVIDCVGGLDRAVKEWGVDFAFIGKKV